MIKKSFAALSALVLLSAFSGSVAQAATTPTATVGGICAKAGSTTAIAGKSYTCVKVLSGKLVWSATPASTSIGGAKPQISGGAGGEGEGPDHGPGGVGEDHGARDVGRQAAFKKYNSCLISHGGTALPVPSNLRGVKPSAPSIQPTVSAAQAKALAACTALAPKLPPRGDD